ncbi:MAG: hypothetical protein ACJASL_000417 [Paraglaciecola sp.]|jgi:hypothetical protein
MGVHPNIFGYLWLVVWRSGRAGSNGVTFTNFGLILFIAL